MITVNIVTDEDRFRKVADALEFLSSEEFFRTIPLAQFETKILMFMRSISPEDRGLTKAYRSSLGLYFKGGMQSFKDGWRVARETSGDSITFRIWNLLETVGGDQGVRKFSALEYGNSASSFIAKRTYVFQSVEGAWVTIKQGRTVQHAGRTGANVIGRTSDYIAQVMLPEIGQHINELITRRLAK